VRERHGETAPERGTSRAHEQRSPGHPPTAVCERDSRAGDYGRIPLRRKAGASIFRFRQLQRRLPHFFKAHPNLWQAVAQVQRRSMRRCLTPLKTSAQLAAMSLPAVDCLAGCGKSAASLDAMPVDRGKPRLFHRATEWTVFNPEVHGWLFPQPARLDGAVVLPRVGKIVRFFRGQLAENFDMRATRS